MCLCVIFVLSNIVSCVFVFLSRTRVYFLVSYCFLFCLWFFLFFNVVVVFFFSKRARNHVEFALYRVHLSKFFQNSLQNSMGGRVRVVISGTAPLRDDVMVFLRCALGCHVSL